MKSPEERARDAWGAVREWLDVTGAINEESSWYWELRAFFVATRELSEEPVEVRDAIRAAVLDALDEARKRANKHACKCRHPGNLEMDGTCSECRRPFSIEVPAIASVRREVQGK